MTNAGEIFCSGDIVTVELLDKSTAHGVVLEMDDDGVGLTTDQHGPQWWDWEQVENIQREADCLGVFSGEGD